jgi:hypothetical protein
MLMTAARSTRLEVAIVLSFVICLGAYLMSSSLTGLAAGARSLRPVVAPTTATPPVGHVWRS